jgi:DNA-binding NarL/FixJ family response regulator
MNDVTRAPRKRILIVDDHPLFRAMLAQLIDRELGLRVCGEADNVKDALALIAEIAPDAVILDITLKGGSGLQLINNLRAKDVHIPVLVLSMHEEDLYAERVLASGGSGYISKLEGPSVIMEAIRRVVEGETYVSERMTGILLDRLRQDGMTMRPAGMHALSTREIEVFQMFGSGMDVSEIAKCLEVREATVATFRARIKEKLQFRSSAELYQQAALWVNTSRL